MTSNRKSSPTAYPKLRVVATENKQAFEQRKKVERGRLWKKPPLKLVRNEYLYVESLAKEARIAGRIHQRIYQLLVNIMGRLDRDHTANVQRIIKLADSMVNSVVRNPDAFTWLSHIEKKDAYTYVHGVRSAVLALSCGRHLGLCRQDLTTLAIGTLLKDIGKTQLNRSLIAKVGRTPDERAAYEKFVHLSINLLKDIPQVEPNVLSVIRQHRERYNGSGYPHGLKDDRICRLAKIAGIATYYDEITRPRETGRTTTPSKAVARLYNLRNIDFHEELVIEFIRAIGLYPTGTLVEINTGAVGIVVEQNFQWRLKPRLLMLLDEEKKRLKNNLFLDLAEDDTRKHQLVESGRKRPEAIKRLEILRDLDPAGYDIDILSVRSEYLFTHNYRKQNWWPLFRDAFGRLFHRKIPPRH